MTLALSSSIDVRLHSPSLGIVVVWVCGDLDAPDEERLRHDVGVQFERAAHVVLDLCHATVAPDAVDVVRRLVKEAADVGVHLHVAAEGECRAALLEAGVDRHSVHQSADEVVTLLR